MVKEINKGTKITVGYRSLIDWYRTGSWSGWGAGAGGLKSRPETWQGTGPQAIPTTKGTKLPGHRGAAWNVKNFDVPKPDSRRHDDIKKNLGNYVPQWVYMMAEHLEYDSQGLSPSRLKNFQANIKQDYARQDVKVGQEIAWNALPKGATSVDLTYAKTYGETVLKEMAGNEGLPQLFGFLRREIEDKFKNSGQTLQGVYEDTSWDMADVSGQTPHEILAEITGGGIVEKDEKWGGRDVHKMLQRRPDPSGRRRGSNPVDITFKESVKIKGEDKQFTRADVTTASYSVSKGHHGIGPKKDRIDDLGRSIKQREITIKGQNNKRVAQFNDMIKTLHSLYGTSDPLELREKIGEERLGKAKWTLDKSYFSPPPTTEAELKKRIAAIDTKTKANFDRELAQALGLEVNQAFKDTIEWVLHALGNHVVGEEYWANVMAIDMHTIGDRLGTLILRYSFMDDGQFKNLADGDVMVLDYSVERFIYDQGMEEKSQIAFEKALQRVNDVITAEGHAMISGETNLMRQQGNSTRIRQTAYLAMPVEGEFAEQMEQWVFALVDSIAKNAQVKLNKDFKDNATTFSKKMRADSRLGKIKNWMSAISDTFLDVPTSPNSINLDFLWTAPYIASVQKQVGAGGANQFEGKFEY